MKTGTQAYEALEAIDEYDGKPTSSDLDDRLPIKRGSLMSVLSGLHEDGYTDREGKGGRHDPYRYTVSAAGRAALRNGTDVEGDAGLDVLFPQDDTDDEPTDDEAPDEMTEDTTPDTIAVEAPVDAWINTLIALSNAHEPNEPTRHDQFDRVLRALIDAGVDV